jgi:hypothetical protein
MHTMLEFSGNIFMMKSTQTNNHGVLQKRIEVIFSLPTVTFLMFPSFHQHWSMNPTPLHISMVIVSKVLRCTTPTCRTYQVVMDTFYNTVHLDLSEFGLAPPSKKKKNLG